MDTHDSPDIIVHIDDNVTPKVRPSYCIHNRQKAQCIDCNGTSICEHKRVKFRCKDCGGNGICKHNKRKTYCKECGGGSIFCKHDIIKYRCKQCKGSEICNHGNRKQFCKECMGSQICIHKRRKDYCKECKGSQICIHNKQKYICVECNGSQTCEHKKWKVYCKLCNGKNLCKSSWCETMVNNKKYNGYCVKCCINLFPDIKVSRNYKTKENTVIEFIKTNFLEYTWVTNKTIIGGCSNRKPDIYVDMGSHILIVEIDEHEHKSYDCICENKRIMELSKDFNHRPLVFLRFNPDSYINRSNVKVLTCWSAGKNGIFKVPQRKYAEWNKRLNILKEQIAYWTHNPTTKTIEVIHLFYDGFD
jgi:hypothetical protein